MSKVKVGIIGATGYAGEELVRLLTSHPGAEITSVASVSFIGKQLSEVYPSLRGVCSLECVSPEDTMNAGCDVIFACVQHGLSQEFAAECDKRGIAFIDLGADFRLENEADYAEWYGGKYIDPELHSRSVYAIPELFRDKIVHSRVISNPGCYPTSVALALYPALKAGLVEADGIVIDSKSGVTGAGRGLTENTHFPLCNEAFSPYKVAAHRHTPEIEQTLSHAVGRPLRVVFVPHLLPVNRGIISTVYSRMRPGVTPEQVRAEYERFYADERFVRLLPDGAIANLRDVKYSNYCDVSLHFDPRTGTLITVGAIDNMVKGAAGQAIQNMNIIFGLPEEAGLTMAPPSF